jgi:hypothetical protein
MNFGASSSRAKCIPRGAYAPRSWLHGAGSPEKTAAAVRTELRCKKRYSRCTIARSQERRASAPRGQRIVVPKEVRVLAAIEHRQERRASARRGRANAYRRTGASFVGRSPTVCVGACAWMAVATAFIGATGGLRPPLLVAARTSAGETTIFAMHKRTFDRERRASARRGFPNRICKCSATNIGVRISRGECITRGAYAPRSWLHDVRSL